MTGENLNVKIVADVSQYKRGMDEAKQATKDFGNSSKQSASNVERLEQTIKEQQEKLKALKGEYTNLVLAQDKSSNAAKELETQMKLLNTQLTMNQQKLQMATAASNSFTTGLDGSAGIGATNESMVDLGATLENISNLQMANVFANMFMAFHEAKDHIRRTTSAFSNFKEELKDVFNFKNFDVGDDGIKGIFQSMKIQGKEAITSLKIAFKHLGEAIKAAMTSAAAAIAATIAVLVTFIALVKNAISTAERMRTIYYEAQKIGMSAAAYEEWGYILHNVGVEVDALSDFLKTLADEQNAVRDGDEAMIKAFNDLGLAAEEVASMSQEKLFSETVKRLQAVENEVERTSIAYRIFGEDAAQLSNVLRLTTEEMDQMTRQYQLLGGEASDSLIKKSLTLSTAVNNLKTAWKGLTNTLGEGFMPMITKVVQWLTKAIAVVNMFVRAMFGFSIISTGSKSTDKATSGMNSYSKAMDKATETAEKLKRTTQGFDELNIVTDPNSKSGADSAVDTGISDNYGAGFDLPDLEGEFQNLGLDKFAKKIEEWSDIIRAVVPAAMVAIGVIGGVLAAMSGNWPAAILFFAMAGIGLVAMTGGEGGFQGYIDNFNTVCNGLLAPAMIAIGAVGGVIALLLGNVPLAIGLFAMAGIGVALTLTDSFSEYSSNFAQKVAAIAITALTAIGAVGGVIALLLGNIPMAIALFAVAAIGVGISANDNFQSLADGFGKKVTLITSIAMVAIGVIGGAIALALGNVPGAIGLFAMAGVGIAGLISAGGFWDEIAGAFKVLFNAIGQWCKDMWNNIVNIFNIVAPFFIAIFKAAWEGIKGVWDVVVAYYKMIWENIKAIFSVVKDVLSAFFKLAWEAIKAIWSVVAAYFKAVWESIKLIFSVVKNVLSGNFKDAWEGIKAIVGVWADYFKTKWEAIKKVFSAVAEFFKSVFQAAWNGIKAIFSNVGTFFGTVRDTIKNTFSKIGTIIGDAVSKTFKSAVNWILEQAIGKINGFIQALNFAIGIINKIPGVNIKTINELNVPKLATGGIAVNDTLAHIGEGGKREAVLPLDQNTEWMDALAEKLAARIGGGNSKVVLQVGEKELGWATINSINGITKQTGGLQLHLV